ncbi:hypothetical protein IIC38_09655 [candidate division KSB1 bacterium]|nr:hypothetical protein [candidate division KSB1 bacterium]
MVENQNPFGLHTITPYLIVERINPYSIPPACVRCRIKRRSTLSGGWQR